MFSRRVKEKPNTLVAKQSYYLLLCLALLSTFALIQEKAQAKEPAALEPLKVALQLSSYTHINDQGIQYGYSPSLVSSISERMDREFEIQVMPYLRILHALKTGQIDMSFGLHVPDSSVYLPGGIVKSSAPQLVLPVSYYALPERKIHLESQEQAGDYRVGTARMETKNQRILRAGQSNENYYKNAYSLIKALKAKHIDLAILDAGSALRITKELGVPLERIYDLNRLEIFPIFSNVSPRIKDPLAFCQSFVETRVEVFNSGEYEKILNDTHMIHLLPYYNQVKILPGHCHLTALKSVNHALKKTRHSKYSPSLDSAADKAS